MPQIKAADALYTKLATHYVSSAMLPQLKQHLLAADSAAQALEIIEKAKAAAQLVKVHS